MSLDQKAECVVAERRKDRRSTISISPYNDLVICVPCYNESKRFQVAAFEKFLNRYTDVHFIFINDGSTDDTAKMLNEFTSRFQRQTVFLNLPNNVGKAEAVRLGLLHAVSMKKSFVGYWDADLATDLSSILDFAKILRDKPQIDVVMGARMQLIGHEINRELKRKIVSKICNLLARVALRQNLKDTQCGAKILRVTNELELAIAEPFETPWLFDVELFKRIGTKSRKNQIFFEYPLPKWNEIDGSNIKLTTIVQSGFSMIKMIIK